MKKGLTYVDVAISFGIFIIYGVFLFLVFKPAISEEYDDDYLTSIVHDNFVKEVYWTINKTPLIVEINGEIGDVDGVSLKFPFNYVDGEVYLEENGDRENYDIINPKMEIEAFTGKKEFVMYISEEFNFYESRSIDGDIYELNEEDGDKVVIGVQEFIFGIQKFYHSYPVKDKFTILFERDYEAVKEDWGYPKSKEFYLKAGDMESGVRPGENVEIEINRLVFNTRFLNEFGITENVEVEILTW